MLTRLRGAIERLASNGGVVRSVVAVRELIRREGWREACGKIVRVVDRQDRYQRWIDAYEPERDDAFQPLRDELGQLARLPLISVVVPVFNTPAHLLSGMIESVLGQIYPHWELCIADDASSEPHVRCLLDDYATRDARIKVVFREQNGHICAASNSALELVGGDYVALLDHDDLLPRHALAVVAKYIDAHPAGRLFYSDEDKISGQGVRSTPYFKPDWDPELIVQQNFFSHLGVYESRLIREVGGFRAGLEGSQDHDLLLRCVQAAGDRAVVHIPHVLYHWRVIEGSTALDIGEKPYAVRAAVRAVADYLSADETGTSVEAPCRDFPFIRVRRPLPNPVPGVRIVVLAHGDDTRLDACIRSLFEYTDYAHYRVSIVGPCSASMDFLSADDAARVTHAGRADDEHHALDEVIEAGDEDYLCICDDAVRLFDRRWLAELMAQAVRPSVGIVGPAIHGPDGRIHAVGLITLPDGTALRAHAGVGSLGIGYFGQAVLTHTVSALPGACMVFRREVWRETGGIDTAASQGFARDVDLSRRVIATGRSSVVVPAAKVMIDADDGHRTTACPSAGQERDESCRDRYYNPNLAITRSGATFEPAFPPRIGRFE
ncbi:glycosyltransferase family 2 protein [Paraburkholderia caballeronis]|uniref:glycosyltransferase family 2 protein n=1 Tax=Paraburkholderia caballeronis TaxID=416943 RepID=UPI00106614FD|nr:glycosyltransferase [Paraburkholderia caballeronis]TDV14425.1 glycosyl transferase family 21 [Paraburkholderia caballeronis]TDV15951.1 glycosyl transferase family 21 [Paraburkholderia caballeronis]TDV25212.1 glycosyl transferase family 21 [Paraburkholderia caballeronis]